MWGIFMRTSSFVRAAHKTDCLQYLTLLCLALLLAHAEPAQGDAPFRPVWPCRLNSGVSATAFSPDGRWLAVGDLSGTVQLWDVRHRRLAANMWGHGARGLAFSPDGRRLVGVDTDMGTTVWEVPTGHRLAALQKPVGVLPGPGAMFRYVAFSPDGRTIVVSGLGEVTSVFDARSFKQVATLTHPPSDEVETVMGPLGDVTPSFLSNGHLVIGANRRGVELWDLKSAHVLETIPLGGELWPVAVAVSPDARTAAVATSDKHVTLYDLAKGRPLRKLAANESLQSLLFTPDGRWLLTRGDSPRLTLYETSSGRRLGSVPAEKYHTAFAVSPDGRTLALGGSFTDGVRLYSLPGLRPMARLAVTAKPIGAVNWTRDGRVQTDNLLWSRSGPPTILPWSGLLSPGGETMAVNNFSTVQLWDVATRKMRGEVEGYVGYMPEALAWQPDGSSLLMVTQGLLLDVTPMGNTRNVSAPEKVTRVVFGRANGVAAVGCDGGAISTVDLGSGEPTPITTLGGDVAALALAPDGERVAAAELGDYSVQLNKRSGELIKKIPLTDRVASVRFSPDGRRLVVASGSRLLAFDMNGRPLPYTLDEQPAVTDMSFSPDGRYLMCGCNGVACLRDAATGRLLASIVHPDAKGWVVVTPDGRAEGTPAALDTTPCWRGSTVVLLRAATRASRNLMSTVLH